MKRHSTLTLLTATLLLAGGAGDLGAADWPWYRGPVRDGRSPETGLLASWPEAGPVELWRLPLGDGYSAISIVGGRAYTQYGAGSDEFALAVDAATGKEIWRFRTDANRPDAQGGGPRSTPTVDGDLVYALSAGGKLWALATADGRPLWSVDLVRELGARVPRWGASTSPLVDGANLIVDVGGRPGHSLVAFDKKSGAVRWHSQTDIAGYSSPLAVAADGVRQILFFTGSALVSVSPEDGRLFWRYPWKTAYDVNAAMPVFVPPNRVFLSSSYDVGAALLAMRKAGDGVAIEEVWRSRVMRNHFNSSVLVDGHLYGFDNATLKCIVAATGEEKWAQRGFQKGSLIYADGRLIVLSERGLLALADATPEGYRERGRVQILRGKTWTMPALADGLLLLRSEKEMVALDLKSSRSGP